MSGLLALSLTSFDGWPWWAVVLCFIFAVTLPVVISRWWDRRK